MDMSFCTFKSSFQILELKLRAVNERRRWEFTMSGAKERDKCEMQLRVPIKRFNREVQTKAERKR